MAISADALQVYAGPRDPHRRRRAARSARGSSTGWSGSCPSPSRFSAGAYAALAHAEIDAALAAGRRPIVVGGTGLYLRAALAELDLRPPAAAGVRERWHAELTRQGPAALHALLAERDATAAAGVSPSDGRRIVRVLELLDTGVEPPPPAGGDSQLWTTDTRHPTLLAGLVMDRAALAERIDRRVDGMVAAGAARGGRARRRRSAPRRPRARRSASRSCSRATSRR